MQNILADNFPEKADINIGPNAENYRTIGNGQGYFIINEAILNIFGADAINDIIESTPDFRVDFKSILKYAYIDGESKIINNTMFGKVSKINRTK